MLEDTWHMDYMRRPEIGDSLFQGGPMWDNYPVYQTKPKTLKGEKVGLAEAIVSSILSSGKYLSVVENCKILALSSS